MPRRWRGPPGGAPGLHRQPILTEYTVAAWDFLAFLPLPEWGGPDVGKTDPFSESAPGTHSEAPTCGDQPEIRGPDPPGCPSPGR